MRQLPAGGEIFLDHIAHFVPGIDEARDALSRCGFLPTPFSVQTAPGPGGAPQPTGTGNVCAMLREGYLEILAKTSDTPLAAELDAAVACWPGVHLAAFTVAEPETAYQRLVGSGVPMRPVVHMRRPVEMEHGTGEARFTVLRLEPGVMAEGRIQLLTHHTEAEVWQPRWLGHPNSVTALLGLLIVSDDLTNAATRFERLLGIAPTRRDRGVHFALRRGHVHLAAPGEMSSIIGKPPGLPWIAAYGLRVDDLAWAATFMRDVDLATTRAGHALAAAFPPALGVGYWVFVEDAAALPWM